MSAPPLANPPIMPTVVSRLPKFGPRAKSASDRPQLGPSAAGTSARLTNGFYHHPGPTGVNSSSTAPARQTGFIRVPTSFSVKWRKENGSMEDGEKDWKRGKGGNRFGNNIPQQASQGQSQHDTKKTATITLGKGRGVGPPVLPSSSPSPQSSPRTLPVLKASQCGLSNGTKQLNALPGSKPHSGTSASLRQPQAFAFSGGPRPGSGSGFGFRSGSPLQKKPPATRSQSTDSLGGSATVQLTESDRFRSRSLTQVRQQNSPTRHPSSPQTVTRPNSNSKTADKGLRERSSPQAPHRSSLFPISSRTVEGGAKGAGVKGQSSGIGLMSVLPSSALKKPLLPSPAPTTKPNGISYRLSRPSLIKQSRPLRVTSASGSGADLEGWRSSAETDTSPDSPEAPGPETPGSQPPTHAELTLEDMSLSSTSSLDRNDTSQEYMDDFDNLGNGCVGVLLLSSKSDEDDSGLDQSCARFDDDKASIDGVSTAPGLCFLEDAVDWAGMRLCGERGGRGLARLSSQLDGHDQGGSSLDLSPSDSCSSGGTYLWDEEGLEPLGGTATSGSINTNTSHHVGSFDSDLNSIDVLNNLDSCDLEDDDLMLDVDLAEDGSLHSDGDGMSHMAQWRRRQLCWGMQDVSNDDNGGLQCYQLTEDPGNKRTAKDSGLVLSLCPPRSPSLSPATPAVSLDVEDLAEDCSAVRSQLEVLQRLLLQEDEVDEDTLTTDTVSPDVDSQVQSLLQEVQQLREELRSRDRTIAELTLKLAVPTATTRRCCQETVRMDRYTQTSVTERESVASQTPWSNHSPQILHASGQRRQEPLMDQVLGCVQAPAPPCSPRPQIPTDGLPLCAGSDPTARGERGGRKDCSAEELKPGAQLRSLPLPSRLRLSPSQSSRATCSPATTPTSRQLPSEPDGSGASGVQLRSLGFSSSSSRLPKPKSY
ncbi:serine-rich coiled-coil domain-containing protein 2 isoform X2 [Betta splendens]|uniref:Serine-rich coiled-coil domain-containing protein 2 isoform X2 n=1 Tax=Betta splendens TaxID=158456 RepID=A0A6P7LAD7_BETSP|nr:serine-rich coiled-coil domain-containing protein 2 isoform X2 [Betta splendens]